MFRKPKITVVLALGVVFFFKSYVIVIGQSANPECCPNARSKVHDAEISAQIPKLVLFTGEVTGRVERGKAPDGIAVAVLE